MGFRDDKWHDPKQIKPSLSVVDSNSKPDAKVETSVTCSENRVDMLKNMNCLL